MVRTLLYLGIVAAQLADTQVAYCRSPDELPNSPIPTLKAPAPRGVARRYAEQASLLPNLLYETQNLRSLSPKTTSAEPREIKNGRTALQSGYVGSTEQTEIWNSPEMREARAYVVEFSRHARQTSSDEGQQFLARLSRLSPEEMRNWLTRYQARRLHLELQRDAEQVARQLMLEHAINRQDALRQAFEHLNNLRTQQMASEEQHLGYAQQRRFARMGEVEGALSTGTQCCDPMEATTDPMNPRGYARRVAGAMTLPGDLPRDDPRNYDRHAADYGEWATTRDAEPPIPAILAPVSPVELPVE